MEKTLAKHGDSHALVIDQAILELVKLNPDEPVEVSTDDGHRLIITQAPSKDRRERFQTALDQVNRTHGKALKRLAE